MCTSAGLQALQASFCGCCCSLHAPPQGCVCLFASLACFLLTCLCLWYITGEQLHLQEFLAALGGLLSPLHARQQLQRAETQPSFLWPARSLLVTKLFHCLCTTYALSAVHQTKRSEKVEAASSVISRHTSATVMRLRRFMLLCSVFLHKATPTFKLHPLSMKFSACCLVALSAVGLVNAGSFDDLKSRFRVRRTEVVDSLPRNDLQLQQAIPLLVAVPSVVLGLDLLFEPERSAKLVLNVDQRYDLSTAVFDC
jgi:hypothetical protein